MKQDYKVIKIYRAKPTLCERIARVWRRIVGPRTPAPCLDLNTWPPMFTRRGTNGGHSNRT